MLALEAHETDDPAFVDIASRLLVGTALASEVPEIVAVHIDHWFGKRWLGFCGKMWGIAGLHDRNLSGPLTPPPFHPHRVKSARTYELTAPDQFNFVGDADGLHDYRSSHSNLLRRLSGKRVYGWYSGNTAKVDRAVLMVYTITEPKNSAWYVAFQKSPTWRLSETINISPRAVEELLEQGSVTSVG